MTLAAHKDLKKGQAVVSLLFIIYLQHKQEGLRIERGLQENESHQLLVFITRKQYFIERPRNNVTSAC
jgi:hypothetical protein